MARKRRHYCRLVDGNSTASVTESTSPTVTAADSNSTNSISPITALGIIPSNINSMGAGHRNTAATNSNRVSESRLCRKNETGNSALKSMGQIADPRLIEPSSNGARTISLSQRQNHHNYNQHRQHRPQPQLKVNQNLATSGSGTDRLDASSDSAVSSMGSERISSLSDGEWGEGSDSAQDFHAGKYTLGSFDFAYNPSNSSVANIVGNRIDTGNYQQQQQQQQQQPPQHQQHPVAQKKHQMFGKRYLTDNLNSNSNNNNTAINSISSNNIVPMVSNAITTNTTNQANLQNQGHSSIKYEYDSYATGPTLHEGGIINHNADNSDNYNMLSTTPSYHGISSMGAHCAVDLPIIPHRSLRNISDVVKHNHSYSMASEIAGMSAVPRTTSKPERRIKEYNVVSNKSLSSKSSASSLSSLSLSRKTLVPNRMLVIDENPENQVSSDDEEDSVDCSDVGRASTSSRQVGNTSKNEERHLTRDEKRARAMNIPIRVTDIINLPMDEFNERLSKYDLSENQLSLIRDIRRRGKNKVAAQNCRKRKLDQILSLEDEVRQVRQRKEQLKKQYDQMILERNRVSEKFSRLHRHIFTYLRDSDGKPCSPSTYSLHQTVDGGVYLMPRDNFAKSDSHRTLSPDISGLNRNGTHFESIETEIGQVEDGQHSGHQHRNLYHHQQLQHQHGQSQSHSNQSLEDSGQNQLSSINRQPLTHHQHHHHHYLFESRVPFDNNFLNNDEVIRRGSELSIESRRGRTINNTTLVSNSVATNRIQTQTKD